MAGKLPMQDEPAVAPRPASPAFFDAHASPDSFGAPQGAALQSLAQDGAAIAMHKRQLDANFAASDAELRYGNDMDAQVEKYKTDLKKLQTENVGDYQSAVDQLRTKYGDALEKSRKQYQGSLQDPLAAKQFALRTRLQTQAAGRHMLVAGDQRVEEWRKGTAEGNVALAVKRAGNVTGDIQTDLANLQVSVGTGIKALQDYHAENAVPPAESAKMVAKIEGDAVHSALKGYGDNYAAGLALLNSKLIGTDMRIGFNPNKPDEPAILNGAETQAWVKHFTEKKTEKVGAGLGMQWVLDGVSDPMKAAAKHVADGGSYEEALKATQEFFSVKTRNYEAQQHAEAQRFKGDYDLVAGQYNRDVDAADRAGALPGRTIMQKDQLREYFRKKPDDPSFNAGRAQFGDVITKGPGWSDNWKSEVDFEAAWRPRVGDGHYPELRALYESDQRRPKESDGRISSETAALEDSLRVALDWRDDGSPNRRHWSDAEIWQQDKHTWAMTQWNAGVNQHHMDVKAGKAGDPNWANSLRASIMQTLLKGRKDADKRAPLPPPMFETRETPAVPESVRAYLNSTVGSKKITDGKQVGWLAPNAPMPAGWKETP